MENSTTVDQRVVEMRIDNDKFEAGAKKTISILESLDKSLNNLGNQHAEGFTNVEKTMDAVTSKFSVFGTIGDQVLRNLTNSAMGLVKELEHMAASLTTQQIDAGWSKYADKTSAVQTIMAATHKDIGSLYKDEAEQLEHVNQQLEKLAWFTDETSYNFIDMVGNIGKFTSNGRGLEESVTAMQGISNWAAISGGKVQEASRAMYNLSQALGMGYVSVADWRSIELANMATSEFKEMVIETASSMGKLQKVAEGTWKVVGSGNKDDPMSGTLVSVENFREGLKKKWFDSDVLLEVLQRYGEFTDGLYEATEDLGTTATEFLEAMEAFKGNNMEKLGAIAKRIGVDINDMLPYLRELSKAEYDLGYRAFVAAQEAKTFQEAIEATKDAVSTKWMEIFEIIFGNYNEAKKLWTGLANTLYNVFAGPVEEIGTFLGEIFGESILDPDSTGEVAEGIQNVGKQTENLEDMLADAGRSALDLWDALREVLSAEEVQALKVQGYEDLDKALKDGKISADQFRRALALMAQNTTKVTEGTAEAGKSFAEMRKVAWEVLRGDWKNGEERKKLLEAAGYDYDTIQWLAGNLNWFGNNVSDEFLLALEKPAHVAEVFAGRVGTSTTKVVKYTEQEMAQMNKMLENYDVLLEQIEDGTISIYQAYDILSGKTEQDLIKYKTVGEIFRDGLKNILKYISDIAVIGTEAFKSIFLGDDQKQTLKDLVIGFYNFSNAIQITDQKTGKLTEHGQALKNRFEGIFRVIRTIGQVIKIAFSIATTVIKSAFYILSPFLELLLDSLGLITDSEKGLFNSVNLSEVEAFFKSVGDSIREFLNTYPIFTIAIAAIGDAISFVAGLFGALFGPSVDNATQEITGFSETTTESFNQMASATQAFTNVSDTFNSFLDKHPILKAVASTIEKLITFVTSHVGTLWNVLKIGGVLLVGIFDSIIVGISKVFSWFGTADTESIKLGSGIDILRKKFSKFEEIISKVAGYIDQGFKNGGITGAVTGLFSALDKGFRKIIPEGTGFLDILSGVWNFLKNGLGTVASFLLAPVAGLSEAISLLWNSIGGKEADENVEAAENSFTKLGNALQGLSDVIFSKPPELKQKVINYLTPIWEGIVEFAHSIKFRDVLSALRLAVITTFLGDVLDFVHVFRHVRNEVDDALETLSYTFEDMGLMFRKLAVSFQANAILKFAAAIAILGIVIYNLTKLAYNDPEDKMTYIATLLMSMMLVITLLVGVINRSKTLTRVDIKQLTVIPRVMGALVGLALLIFAVANAISKIGKIGDLKAIATAFAPIAVVLAIFVATIIAITSIVSKQQDLTERGAKFNAIGTAIMKITGGMIFMALAIQMLLIPIALFARIIRNNEGGAGLVGASAIVGLALAAVFAVMLILTKSLNKIKSNDQGDRILAIAKAVQKMASSMFVLALAVDMLLVPIALFAAIIAKGGGIPLVQSLALVGLLLAAIIRFYQRLITSFGTLTPTKLQSIGPTFMKMAGSMLGLAFAVDMMVAPIIVLAVLAKTLGNDLWIAAGVVSGIVILFSGIIALLAYISSKAKSPKRISDFGTFLVKLAASMLIFAAAGVVFGVALISIAVGIKVLSQVIPKIENFWETLLTLAVVAGAMWLFGTAAKSLGKSLLLMAAAFLVFSAGLYVLGHAMDAIANWWPKFKEFLIGFKERLKKGDWKTIAVVIGLFTLFCLALRAVNNITSKSNHMFSFFDLFNKKTKNMATTVTSGIGSLPRRLAGLFGKVSDAFIKHREELGKAIGGIIIVIGLYIIDIIPTVTNMIVEAFIQLLVSVARAINEHRSRFVDAITDILASIFNLFAEVIGKIFSFGKDSLWSKLTDGGKILTIATVIGALVLGAFKLYKAFKGIGDASKDIAANADKVIEVVKVVGAQGNVWGAYGTQAANAAMTFGGAAAGAKAGAAGAGAGAGAAAGAAGSAGFWATFFSAGAGWLGPIAILAASVAAAFIGTKRQNSYLRNEAFDDKDYSNLQDRINGLNELRESYEKSIDEYNKLAESDDGSALWGKQQEVDARFLAWHDELKALSELTGQTIEEILHQQKDGMDPLENYIQVAYENRNANKELKKSYDELYTSLEKNGISKETFEYYRQMNGGDLKRALDYMASTGVINKETKDNLDAIIIKTNNYAQAVKALNESYDVLAERLGLTRSEFDRQLQKAGGDISQMDAYIARQKEYSDLIRFNLDGTVELTAKGVQMAEAQTQAAKEQLEQIQKISKEHGIDLDFDINSMSSEEILTKVNGFKSSFLGAIKDAGFGDGSLFSFNDLLNSESFDPIALVKSFGVESIPEAIGTTVSENKGLLDSGFEDMEAYSEELFNTLFEVNSPSHVFQRLGESIPEGVVEGIKAGVKVAAVANPFARLINLLIGQSESMNSEAYILGQGIGESFVNGIVGTYGSTNLGGLGFTRSMPQTSFGNYRANNLTLNSKTVSLKTSSNAGLLGQDFNKTEYRKWLIIQDTQERTYGILEQVAQEQAARENNILSKWDEYIRKDKNESTASSQSIISSEDLAELIDHLNQYTTESQKQFTEYQNQNGKESKISDAFVDAEEWKNVVDKYNLKYLLGSNSNVSEWLQGKDFIETLFDKAVELGYLEYDFPDGGIPDKLYYKTTEKAGKAGESFSYNFNVDDFTDSIPLGWLTDAILEEVIKAFNLVPKSPEVQESGEEIGNKIGESATDFIQSSWEDFLQSEYYKPGQETIYWEEGLGVPEGWYTFDNNSMSAMYAGTAYRQYLYDQLVLLEDKSEEANTEFMEGLNRLREESERQLSAHGFTGRTRNVTGKAESIEKGEQGLGTGPVGITVDWDKLQQEAQTGGQKYSQGIKSGVEQGLPKVKDTITDAIDSYNEETLTLSGKIPESMAIGITEKSGNVNDAVKRVQSILSSPWASVSRNFYNYGSNIASGLVSGLQSRYYQVSSIVSSLASMVSRAFSSVLKIRSPSKVFEYYGQMIDEGLSQGVEESSEDAIESIVVLGDDIIKAIYQHMAEVGLVASDQITEKLSPRPVFDLSNLDAESKAIAERNANKYLTMVRATESAYANATAAIGRPYSGNYNTGNITYVNQNQDVVAELQDLSGKVGRLGQEITNMKVVLNTGALVGELAPAMNRQLGVYANRELRQ